jgi:hypothetical protein
MGPVSISIPIDVPRERAFGFVADLANRPSFMGEFLEEFRLQQLTSVGVGAGARFRVRRPGVWMESVIDELDAPYRIFERGSGSRLGAMPIFTVWEVTEAGANGCEVRVVHWTEPSKPLDRIADHKPGLVRSYRRGLTDSLAQLKLALEEDQATQRVGVAGGDRVPGAG